MKDLFEYYENLPDNVRAIVNQFSEIDADYLDCEQFVEKLNLIGYTCEFGLDALPFNLKKL